MSNPSFFIPGSTPEIIEIIFQYEAKNTFFFNNDGLQKIFSWQ